MSVKIIAFGHRRRVGKDTAVMFAVNHLKSQGICNCHRLSLFERIKDIAHPVFKWGGLEDAVYYENHPQKKDIVLPPIGKSPRQIWIELGESLHAICPTTVCEMAFTGLKDGIYFVSDLRRPIEAEYIKKFGGILVKIERPEIPESDDVVDSALASFTDWDAVVHNDSSLRDFVTKIQTLADLYSV